MLTHHPLVSHVSMPDQSMASNVPKPRCHNSLCLHFWDTPFPLATCQQNTFAAKATTLLSPHPQQTVYHPSDSLPLVQKHHRINHPRYLVNENPCKLSYAPPGGSNTCDSVGLSVDPSICLDSVANETSYSAAYLVTRSPLTHPL